MSYAVRNDGQGFRAVGSKDDCTTDETYQAEQPVIVIDPQVNINAEARAYLLSTDWYVVRFAETGVAIPAEIAEARKLARESVK